MTGTFCRNCGSVIASKKNAERARRRGYGFCSSRCSGARRKSLFSRFSERVSPEPNTGCWLWLGSLNPHGYAQLGAGGAGTGSRTAHRVAFEIFKRPLNHGEVVCHSCDNPQCVNPDHLFVGTDADNVRDCISKGRNAFGERCGQSKLSDEIVRAIRKSDKTHSELAREYGCSVACISNARAGKTWRHVPMQDNIDPDQVLKEHGRAA